MTDTDGRGRTAKRRRGALRGALLATMIALPATLAAQRGEVAVLGGVVQSSGEEFDRVTSSFGGPSIYTRERGVRESRAAFGAALSFAIRGHVFGELGVLHHGVERRISRTGTGDPNGPFLVTNRYDGAITSFWMGPSYRFVDGERLAVSGVAAPTLLLMTGEAFDSEQVFDNGPSRSAALGVMLGLRARYWLTERLGAQLSVEDVMWTFPLSPHPSDGTPLYPDTYRKTPLQHDLRAQLGVTFRMF